jgi:tRNA A-37 threonylcarbamoyl transferase component Bud32
MLSSWQVMPQWKDVFTSLAQAVDLKGDLINENWMSRLVLAEVDGTRFYVKIYARRGRWLRRFLGRSRIRAEWENIQAFGRLNVPTANLIGFGEQVTDQGYRGVMITEEVKDTRDLAALIREGHPVMDERKWRLAVIRRLSVAVRRLHEGGFAHNDLKWRNILVELGEDPAVYLIDCPQGLFLRGPLLSRGLAKDMACLDKLGRTALSRSDRLRFYLMTRNMATLSKRAKREIRRVLSFF